MKFLVLFLVLIGIARAVPYTFTLTGAADLQVIDSVPIAFGETFTAQFLVDTSTPDSTAGDPVLARYFHGHGANIQFSGGFTLVDQPFEYRVVDSGFSPVINTTLDALIFDLQQPGYSLAFAFRFTPDTWNSDSADTPIESPLTPDSVGGLEPAELLYYSSQGRINGTITGFTITPLNVPESGLVLPIALFFIAGLALLARRTGAHK